MYLYKKCYLFIEIFVMNFVDIDFVNIFVYKYVMLCVICKIDRYNVRSFDKNPIFGPFLRMLKILFVKLITL